MAQRVCIQCFPSGDTEFAAHVVAAISDDTADCAAVEAALRATYPRVRIVPRHPVAGFTDGPLWYCYRDGSPLAVADGIGAMRAWTRTEVAIRRSVDLMDWSARLIEAAKAHSA